MAIFDTWFDKQLHRLASHVVDLMAVEPIVKARAYRQGHHKSQLQVKPNQFDDNIALNYTGLIEARIVSQMFGKGIELDFEGETETEQERYIKALLDANKQEVLFHRAALSAGEAGTGYLLIIPDGITGRDGVTYPRLQLIDPAYVRMDALPEDYEVVIRYTIEYRFIAEDEKEHARRRVIEHTAPELDATGILTGGNTWVIKDFEQTANGRWVETGQTDWPYDFPPILHWQNLPSVADCYGEPDITANLLELQDRINFVASNISKLIRFYAHPMRYGVNIGEMKGVDVGPDQMLRITGTDADLRQLEPLGDLASSLTFLDGLTKALYATARVTDVSSYEDRLGALTNFGLRVLYQDNLSMIDTKRELFGDMLIELVRRILILTGKEDNPCVVVWPEFLPSSEVEEITATRTKLEMGLTSKQTAATKLGLDWETEQARIEEERAGEDNIGNALLRAFNRGNQTIDER